MGLAILVFLCVFVAAINTCVYATCCTYRNGITPDVRLLLLFCLHIALVSFCGCGGRGEEGWGALSNEAPPSRPRKRTHFCLLIGFCGNSLGHHFLHTHFISCCAFPGVCGSRGQDPYPNVLISLCRAAMSLIRSGVPLESK